MSPVNLRVFSIGFSLLVGTAYGYTQAVSTKLSGILISIDGWVLVSVDQNYFDSLPLPFSSNSINAVHSVVVARVESRQALQANSDIHSFVEREANNLDS